MKNILISILLFNLIHPSINGQTYSDWCLSNHRHTELEYSWGEIDAIFRLPNGSSYCFQNQYLFKIDSIKENGLIVLNKDYIRDGRELWKNIFKYNFSSIMSSQILSNIVEVFVQNHIVFTLDINNNLHESEPKYLTPEDLKAIYPYLYDLIHNKNSDFYGFQEIIPLKCKYRNWNEYCPLVFYRLRKTFKQVFRYYYSTDSDKYIRDEEYKNSTVSAGYPLSQKVQTESGIKRYRNNTICLLFSRFENKKTNVFALFQLDIKEWDIKPDQKNSYERGLTRKSLFRPNQNWFGCPNSLCFFAAIDAIANAFNDTIYIFSGNYFWKWNNSLDYPKVKDAILLEPQFRYIDSAYMDTESVTLYVFKSDQMIRFNDNHYNERDVKKISQTFKGLESDIEATNFNPRTKLFNFFKKDKYWVYSHEKQFIKSGKIKELGLPNNLDAAFVYDNGDDIYVKKNFHYIKEYGVYKPVIVQKFFKCTEDYYSKNLIPEIKTFNEFESQINLFEPPEYGISVSESTLKPNEVTEEDIWDPMTDNDQHLTTDEDPTDEEFKITLWLIIALLFGGLIFGIFFTAISFWCGLAFAQKSAPTANRKHIQSSKRLKERKPTDH